MADSRCGLKCTGCVWKESHGCGGCIETKGNPFHGQCPVAVCCQNKNHEHCGECAEIPCKLLSDYSCHSEHGDNPHGARIEQCKKWKQEATLTPCGIDCKKDCPEFEKSCEGCSKMKGKLFWTSYFNKTVCPMYDCCVNDNKFEHCGQCDKMPCKTFYDCKAPNVSEEEHRKRVDKKAEFLRGRNKK